MQQLINIDKDYLNWFSEIKNKIRSTQIRAALVANATLIEFYYDLGRMIVEKQAQSAWGDKLVQQLSKDLQAEFPEMSGLSFTNLTYCKMFYKYFQSVSNFSTEIYPQPVDKLQACEKQIKTINPQAVEQLQIDDNQKNIIFQQTIGKLDSRFGGQLSPEVGEKFKNLVFNTPSIK